MVFDQMIGGYEEPRAARLRHDDFDMNPADENMHDVYPDLGHSITTRGDDLDAAIKASLDTYGSNNLSEEEQLRRALEESKNFF
jgi:hypothetical protein